MPCDELELVEQCKLNAVAARTIVDVLKAHPLRIRSPG
jgi:hypothetical protein